MRSPRISMLPIRLRPGARAAHGARRCALAAAMLALAATPLRAQHTGHPHVVVQPDTTRARPPAHEHVHTAPKARATKAAAPHAHTDADAHAHDHATMTGMYGPYPMSREASGTAWQPERAPHEGIHVMRGGWMIMLHGFANLIYDRQGGGRGDDQWLGTNMGMAMGTRGLGPGTAGFRAMLSAEPATVGTDGYPLLLQTGETADGREHLIDRQHPHDLFMELAATYHVADATRSAFVYFGLPGEPALGPPAFMHRVSGVEIPESPIGHHWLDSSHITFGVATVGFTRRGLKLEASKFTGREPDQHRTDIEDPKFDSHAFRATLNPSPRWSLQASYGRIHSPEQLAPDVDVDRGTFSIAYDAGRAGRPWQSMLAWGQNHNHPGHLLDAWLLESTGSWGRHTLMGRVERVEKDELFPEGDPRADEVYIVGKAGAGYIYDLLAREHWVLGVGGYGTVSLVPSRLEDEYGWNQGSAMVFARVRAR